MRNPENQTLEGIRARPPHAICGGGAVGRLRKALMLGGRSSWFVCSIHVSPFSGSSVLRERVRWAWVELGPYLLLQGGLSSWIDSPSKSIRGLCWREQVMGAGQPEWNSCPLLSSRVLGWGEMNSRMKNLPSKVPRGSVRWQRRVPVENHFCLVKDTISLITDFFPCKAQEGLA